MYNFSIQLKLDSFAKNLGDPEIEYKSLKGTMDQILLNLKKINQGELSGERYYISIFMYINILNVKSYNIHITFICVLNCTLTFYITNMYGVYCTPVILYLCMEYFVYQHIRLQIYTVFTINQVILMYVLYFTSIY